MSVTAEQLMVEVRADVRQALAGLSAVEAKSQSTGKRIASFGRSMGLAFGGAAIVGGIAKTVNLAKNFDLTMRQVGTQTDLSGQKLAGFSELAKRMGAETIYSAQDAADAMLNLAKGGLTPAQIKAGALEEALRLAAAGGLGLADSSQAIVRGMGAFGLGAKDAVRVTTALAGGANASSAEVSDLTQALSQVGPGAKQAGLTIEETVAALAAFDVAGVRGSDAGTSLKTMLARLVPQTDKAAKAMKNAGLEFTTADGNFKSLKDIAGELQEDLGGLSKVERTRALNTIFGADASRAAAILMDQGRKGVVKFTRAAKDQDKAQEMANTTMEGASGAIENFKGSVETAAIGIGQKALPAVEKFLNAGTDLVNDAMTWGPDIAESFGWIIPAVKDTAGVLADVVKVGAGAVRLFNDLPGGVKSTVTQVALAALIFPRLSAAATGAATSVVGSFTAMSAKAKQFSAEMTYAQTRTQALMGATKTLAGVAGMAALIASSQTANEELSALGSVAGGAAVGFSMGGPWGAAIGTLGGVAKATFDVTNKQRATRDAVDAAAQAMSDATNKAGEYAASLDQVTGAATKQTRADILSQAVKADILGSLRTLGVHNRDLIGTVLGNEGATKRLTTAMREHHSELTATQQVRLNEWLRTNTHGFAVQSEQVRRNAQDTKTWNQVLKGLPPKVRSEVKAIGVDISERQVKRLQRQYDLTPKQVETILAATGTETTIRKVKGVWTVFREGEKIKPNLNNWVGGLLEGATSGEKVSKRGADRTLDALGKVDKAKADLGLFTNSVTTALTNLVGPANTGGRGVGTAIGQGAQGGIMAYTAIVAAQAAAMVRAAIRAARAEAKAKSPSRVTMELGNDMGDGLALGMKARGSDVAFAGTEMAKKAGEAAQKMTKEQKERLKDRGKELAQSLVASLRAGGNEAQRAIESARKWAKKYLKGDAEEKFLEGVNKRNKRLKTLYAKRVDIEKALAAAQATLEAKRNEKASFVESATAGMASQASVIGVGSTAAGIKQSLLGRLAKVREFAGLLLKLKGMGYSNSILAELAAAGVDGGLQAARALASASQEDAATIQGAYSEIQAIAGTTAQALGGQMYDAGIEAAEGLVQGLKDRRDRIEAEILAIAKAMVRSIRKALGIASPSKVMAKLGRFTGQGFAVGLVKSQRDVAKASIGLVRAAVPSLSASEVYTRTPFAGTPSPGAMGAAVVNNVSMTFQVNNPQAEPTGRSAADALTRAAVLGLV